MKDDQVFQRQSNDVLIVDDSAPNLKFLSEILSADGYLVRQAINGNMALQRLKEKLPSIILLDVMMPEMDGFEVCSYLKSDPFTSNIPVIFISALDDEESKLQGFKVGGVDYITKPFRREEVLARVKTHVILYNTVKELEIRKNILLEEIEERKLTEEKLLESEERYRTTLYSIGDGVITTDANGRIRVMNQVAEQLTGWTMVEAFGQTLEEVFRIINEETRGAVEIPVRKVLREGVIVGLANHTLLIAKDDTERPIADSGAPIRNEKGEVVGVVLVFRDQTDERLADKVLRESEERFRKAIIEAPFPIMIHADNDEVIAISRGWTEMSGYKKSDMPTTREWTKLAFSTEQVIAKSKIDSLYEIDHWVDEGEHEIQSKSGERRIWDFSSSPLGRLSDGRRLVISMAKDVTDSKVASDAIQNERKLLRTLIDNLPVTIYVKDQATRKIVANALDLEVMGILNEADVIGKTDLELFDIEIGQRGYADDMKVIQTGQPVINREEVFMDKDGFHRWLLTSKIPLFDHQGKPTGLVGIGRDITEMKKAEMQIKKLTKSIEQSPSSVIITDIQGNIEYVNPMFSEISGYTKEEVLGKNPRILKSGKMPLEVYRQLWDTITAGEVWRGEFRNRKKNGELYWEWATMTSIKNEDGEITNYIAIKENISLRKQMEADLVVAKNKAEESDRLKSAFLANMSHEIRTPLNSIIGFSELLDDSDFEIDQKKEFIQHIITNGNNLLNIISDIMDISRMESGQVTIRESQIHVNKFIGGIKEQFVIKFEGTNVEFKLEIPNSDQEVFILADDDRLRQIFNNLISNALKFTTEGYIQIRYQVKGGMVEFCVADTGIGIPPDYHDKIFDRFRQVESFNSRKYGGNGLGLAITKNLVELMGGKIWMESDYGKGSRFYFVLPLFSGN